MASNQIIDEVQGRMTELGITQMELAAACGLSQPHLSKVLSKHIKLAKKTAHNLTVWLEATETGSETSPPDIVRSLAARLEKLRPTKRMQIMQLLKAIERLIET